MSHTNGTLECRNDPTELGADLAVLDSAAVQNSPVARDSERGHRESPLVRGPRERRTAEHTHAVHTHHGRSMISALHDLVEGEHASLCGIVLQALPACQLGDVVECALGQISQEVAYLQTNKTVRLCQAQGSRAPVKIVQQV